ncbi:MAG: hypothetical protein ACKVP5_12480 [Aestuariivirga sp.]
MPQFAPVIDLSTLDGTNGFRLDGIDANDQSGRSVASAGDVNGDGFGDIVIGAFGGDPRGDYNAGESYVVFGKSSGFTPSLDLASLDGSNGFRLDGRDRFDYAGRSVASAGDINGDGFGDIIVGADLGGAAGESYVVFGTNAGFAAAIDLGSLDGANGFRLDGVDGGDGSGRSVGSAGDVNGDGFADLIIGARYANGSRGESYVVFGNSGGFAPAFDLASLDGANGFRIDGIDATDLSGHSVASAGDVNGDGFGDVIIGAFSADPGGDYRGGASYVVFGRAGGFAPAFSLAGLDGTNGFRIDGIDANDFSGTSVASAGDVNGDGFDDLIVGAFGASPGGESYVVFGKTGGFAPVLDPASLDGRNGFRIDAANQGDSAGYSVASAGDVNGDGFADLIVGAPIAGNFTGASFVVFGKPGGFDEDIELAKLDGNDGFRLDGFSAGGQLGSSVASAGDVNGDGFGDLIVGAYRADGSSGESHVVFGHRAFTAVTITGTDTGLAHNGGFENDTINAFGGDDKVRGFEGDDVVSGGEGNDTIDGGEGDDLIDGGNGDDFIVDGRGNDTITAGAGRDTILILSGNDFVNGGAGRDMLDFRNHVGPIGISLADNSFDDPGDRDQLIFTSIEDVRGTSQNDVITGSLAANFLLGFLGNDRLDGAGGADLLEGGLGADLMSGGAAGDRFIFRALAESGTSAATRDVITDFTVNPALGASVIDRIDLNVIDAQDGTAGNQAFTFIAGADFTAEGQVRAFQSGSDTIVEINTIGTAGADMTIQLSNFTATNLTAADFIL